MAIKIEESSESIVVGRCLIVSAIMAGKVQLAFLLVAAAFVCNDAAPLADEYNLSSVQKNETVILDDAFDRMLPDLRSFIIKNGLDPMELIDISESLLPDLPGIFKGSLDLRKGWAQNLALLKRTNHVIGRYVEQKMILYLDLGFDVMDFNYEYDIKYLLFHRKGDVYGRLHNLDTHIELTIDLVKKHISIDSMKFTSVGKYDIKFEGHILDAVLNAATKAVTTIFRKQVLTFIEKRALEIFQAKINEWDKILQFNEPINYNELMEVPIHMKTWKANSDTFDTKIKDIRVQ